MKITITFTQMKQGKSYDIQVSGAQKIEDTLQVLQDNLHMFEQPEAIRIVQERETGRKIATECTYEEARIYSGAELLIQE